MRTRVIFFFIIQLLLVAYAQGQVPQKTLLKIVQAEDSRDFNQSIEQLITKGNSEVRTRAILAAGRIGDKRALGPLGVSLRSRDTQIATMAAFAIGEIESVEGIDILIASISDSREPVKARIVEALGKICGANLKEPAISKAQDALLDTLEDETTKLSGTTHQSPTIIRMGVTAVMRARPENGAEAVKPFLTNLNVDVRADALNAFARLGGKNADDIAKGLLLSDDSPIVRANAARVLGISGSKESEKILLEAAVGDPDSRVRVGAVRALASLGNEGTADALLVRTKQLLDVAERSPFKTPNEKTELLEIIATLGRLKRLTADVETIKALKQFRKLDRMQSPEVEIALIRIDPKGYLASVDEYVSLTSPAGKIQMAPMFQGLGELGRMPDDKTGDAKREARMLFVRYLADWSAARSQKRKDDRLDGRVEMINAFTEFQSPNIVSILREFLTAEEDVQTRTAITSFLGKQGKDEESFDVVQRALEFALREDVQNNDAILASLEALQKMDPVRAVGPLKQALSSVDVIVRRKAVELLKASGVEATDLGLTKVKGWTGATQNKLGQRILTKADYIRAIKRKNGRATAMFVTDKGNFSINLLPEDAPLTVENFIRLAKSGYFNGLTVHRVVANFVMQDGDPDGDGNGGPGWNIRCEVNMVPYNRGAVGMALSGKDTGGSQWFATHSPQPHLDGGYTVFGKIDETGMGVVDQIVRGDVIRSVTIIEKR